MTEPSLSVVVPTYQRRDPVRRLLDALAPQLAADDEVIVVVDGSTDGTVEMLGAMSYPVPLRVQTQPNSGLAAARNAGIAAATGDVVWLVDDDMIPSDGLVDRHRRVHQDGGEARFLMGPCLPPPEV